MMEAVPGDGEYQNERGRTRARHGHVFAALPERLTFTVDVEEDGAGPDRAMTMTERLLDLLESFGARASFFIVGELAEARPALVRAIATRGHEIGSHGHRHRPLETEGAERLRQDLPRARRRLEDLSGMPVLGFRAPLFSLTRATPWAPDLLAEAGFTYSSSVLPARNWLHGWSGAPRQPFLWPSGLLEIPVPVARIGPLVLPVLGGMYLRYLPGWDLRRMARRLADTQGDSLWSYCHPYDLDADARFERRPDLGLVSSFFLWANRGLMAGRLAALLAGRCSVPFVERLDGWRQSAQHFDPVHAHGMNWGRLRLVRARDAPARSPS